MQKHNWWSQHMCYDYVCRYSIWDWHHFEGHEIYTIPNLLWSVFCLYILRKNDGAIKRLECERLQWRHYERVCVSNHQPYYCLLSRLFKTQIKENIKAPRHWPLCGESTGDRKMLPFDDVIMLQSWESLYVPLLTLPLVHFDHRFVSGRCDSRCHVIDLADCRAMLPVTRMPITVKTKLIVTHSNTH